MTMPVEIRRYAARLAVAMAVYVLALVGVNIWFRSAPPHGWIAYAAAILPALPIASIFVIIGRLLVEMRDEYVRARMIRQSMIATGVTLSITTGWGFLEGFGLVDHVRGYYAATIWFSALGIATCGGQLIDYLKLRATR